MLPGRFWQLAAAIEAGNMKRSAGPVSCIGSGKEATCTHDGPVPEVSTVDSYLDLIHTCTNVLGKTEDELVDEKQCNAFASKVHKHHDIGGYKVDTVNPCKWIPGEPFKGRIQDFLRGRPHGPGSGWHIGYCDVDCDKLRNLAFKAACES